MIYIRTRFLISDIYTIVFITDLVLCPPLLHLCHGPRPPGHGQSLGVSPHRLPHLVRLAPPDIRCELTMETLTTHLSGGSDALVGDLAGEEMMRESTDPEPDPAESKCGGSKCTVLIRVILTPCVMMMVTSERM